MERPVVLIDVYSVFFRAHHALPPMNTRAGEPTSAMYGFSSLLIKVLREHRPQGLSFALDAPQRTFRHATYASYKAGRPRTPDALSAQLGRLHELLQALGVPALVAPGFEADDVLASVADRLATDGHEVLVVSGDRDLLQLASERVRILFLGARGREATLYDAAAVTQRFAVRPEQLPSWMALVGDPSDNLPGVSGVGARTAAKLVARYGSVDELLRQLDDVTPPKIRDALAAAAPQLRMNEQLAALRRDVPIGQAPWARAVDGAAFARVRALFTELEFSSLLERLAAVEELLSPALN